MEFRPVTEDYAVSGQIAPDDVAAVSQAGFRSIGCLRPDVEQPGLPAAASVAAAAAAQGLPFRHIPIWNGQPVPEESLQAMRDALEQLPKPIFAYCRSGARSTNLLMMVQSS